MYRMLLTLTLLFLVAPVSGQHAPVVPGRAEVVFVDYFTRAPGIGYNEVETLRNGIMECMMRNGRVVPKDAGAIPALLVEREEQSTGAFIKDKAAREQILRCMGVRYVLTGHIRALNMAEKQEAGAPVCYGGSLAFVLKVKDLFDASVRFAGVYSYAGLTGCTPGEAIRRAYGRMAPEIDAFVRLNFKAEGLMVQVERNRKGVAEEVYVDLGFAQGVKCGQRLDVYAARQGYGKSGRENIGVLQVIEVLGDEISVCRIKRGRKKIQEVFEVTQAVIPERRFLFARVVVR